MITVQILEANDIVQGDDWCRPLDIISMSGGMSDDYSFKNCYSGTPENNSEWTRVNTVFGSMWFGKPVRDFPKFRRMEFVRGSIPRSHCIDMRNYNDITKQAR